MDMLLRRFCLLHVILTFTVGVSSSDNNETSPSDHRQSRVTGRIVKVYSGTRPEPISCTDEGFKEDPHDCAVFYRCMKSGNGKFTVFRFQCGPGTVYDPETEVCNHPRNTKRMQCGGFPPTISNPVHMNEIEDVQHEIPSPITTNLPYSEITTRASVMTSNSWTTSRSSIASTKRQKLEPLTSTKTYPWDTSSQYSNIIFQSTIDYPSKTEKPISQQPIYTTKVTLPPFDTQTSSRDNICTSDGFMGDSQNCRKFYRCVANQRGSYTRYEFSCSESTVWDDETQSCNHAWAVKRSRCGKSDLNNDNTIPLIPITTSITEKSDVKTTKDYIKYSTDKTIQQQLQISYGSKVTQTQTQISNGPVVQNQTQIHYGDKIKPHIDSTAEQNQTQVSNGSAISQTQTQINYGDKGAQTQLQIDHSKLSSQAQIQIYESTTKGSPTSTQLSNSNGNMESNNQCVKSGFMGDTHDCKKFYRCIENGKGGFTKFEFSCGQGTVWDQTIEACNHAWAVKACGGNDIIEAPHSELTTSKSTQNYYTSTTENYNTTSQSIATEDNDDSGYGGQNQEQSTTASITASTTTSTAIIHSTSKTPSKDCQSSGFIGDENDCKIFYRCIEDGKGSYTKYEFKCGEGTVWDQELEACNHAWAVKRCGGNISSGHTSETTTTTQTTPFTTHSESNTTPQLTSEILPTQTDDSDVGYGSQNNIDISTSTSKPSSPNNSMDGNKCKFSGFIGDEKDCKKFYRCVENGNGGFTRYEFTCGEGTVWDPKIDACNHAWAVDNCGGSGSTTSNHDTSMWLESTVSTQSATSSTGSNTNHPTYVPSTTSSSTKVTESPSTHENECNNSGFMGDQNDCKKFYRCVNNGDGSFTKYDFSCGEGTLWDKEIEACNHAWAVKKCGTPNGVSTSSSTHLETTSQIHPTLSDEIDEGYPSNTNIDSGVSVQTTTHSTIEITKEPNSNNSCKTNGFIGDKNDCKKFYRCVDDGKGGFTRYEFSCGEGTLWDQSIEACNHAWAVKNCGFVETSTTNAETEVISLTTSVTSQSGDNEYPQYTEKPSATTDSNLTNIESCSKDGFLSDKNDCKKFYRCVDNGQGGYIKYEFICGESTYWNQDILSCDHVTAGKECGTKETTSTTKMPPHEHDEIITESTVTYGSSSTEHVEEHTTSKLDTTSGYICESEGFYGDNNDCKKFYRCVSDGKASYTKYEFTCGQGTVWDQELQTCNYESSSTKCSSSLKPITSTTTSQSQSSDSGTSFTTETQHSTETTSKSPSAINTQCTSEGFFADPNDCKKFIRCVNNDKGGYTKYEFSCGDGTVWVQDILACDHDTQDGVCSTRTTTKPAITDEHSQTTQKHESDLTTSSTSTTTQQTDKLDDEYNGENHPSSSSQNGVCTSEGFYANQNDCKQFYRCVDNGQGGYTKYDFTCGEGTAWDSEIQNCNYIDQVKSCQGSSLMPPVMNDDDNVQTTESSLSTMTSSTTLGDNLQSSSTTEVYTTTKSSTSSGDSSQTGGISQNICVKEGYFGDKQNCKKFYRCVDNGKGSYTKYDFDCGEGTIWDQDITTCNHPQDVVNPSCSQNQDIGTSSSSSSSSETSSTTTEKSSASSGALETTSSTTEKSSQSSSNCSQEETSKKPGSTTVNCSKAGYFANPDDCKKFYRCVDWDGNGQKFSVYHFECGEGTIWDPAVETCNHEESVYPPRDCSGSQSQAQNENQTTSEGTAMTQASTSTSEESTTTTQESTSTSQESTSTTQESTSTTTDKTTTIEQITSQQTTTQQSTPSEQTTTQQSSSSEQTTTQKSTTSLQTTTQQAMTSEATSQQTTTQQTPTEQTTTQQDTTSEKTTTQKSTTSEQTTPQQTTTTEQTTTLQSTTTEQTTQQPTTSQQTTQQSTSEQTTQQSTSEQTTQQSTTSDQLTQQPTTDQTSTQQSTTTTERSTTESTTGQSTDESTTQQTSTEAAEQNTTENSTDNLTEGSTTEQATENSTSGQETSTDKNSLEKECPETDDNQNLFVCPTSFRRHPKYCNLFYQCDEDDDTHDVKIAIFTCPNNTIYDESQIRCVDENKADKKCNGQIAQKRRFKRLKRNYKEPIVASKESYACSSAGYFPFEKESECSPAFLKCKTDKSNILSGIVYQCPTGYLYWSISKRCEPASKVKDCNQSQNDWNERWQIPVERRNVAYK